jgi:two-component system response regulator FlrC
MTGGQMEAINVELFGNDPKVLKAVQFAKNVAVTKAPILIIGEVGTGKRTLGNFIHQESSRRVGDMQVVDCSEDAQVVENNILGHRDPETGRFTKGALESANGGTVIMANVDALDESFQKRLHVIFQELEDYEIDVRIISTTTKNLSKLVGAGRFYRGLYMFLSGTQIVLPPLRERSTDIKTLAMAYLNNICDEKEVGDVQISDAAMDKLLSHYWTHNVSELRSVVENSLGNNTDGILDVDDLAIGERKTVSMIADSDDDGITLMSLKEAERLLIKKALIHTSENRTQAAKILGVSIRTLRNKINEYRGEGNSFFVNLR